METGLLSPHITYIIIASDRRGMAQDTDSGEHACGCGAAFDTLEDLKEHAKAEHPDLYEEKFGG